MKRVVQFIVVKEVEKKEKLFLYYSFNGFKFHIPTLELKDNLEVIQIDNIISESVDEKNLLSIQFCKKVYTGLKERKLILMI